MARSTRTPKAPKIGPDGKPVKARTATKEQRVQRAAASWANSQGFGLAFSMLGADARQQIGSKCLALAKAQRRADKAQANVTAALAECSAQVDALREAQGTIEAASKGAIARLTGIASSTVAAAVAAPTTSPTEDEFAS